MQLILPAEVRDQIVEHAFQCLPCEAVGVLGGKNSQVHLALALKNIGAQGTFLADACDQFRAEKVIRSKGLDVLAIYHSHPDGCTCLSDLDVAFAKRWQCVHIVVSLETHIGRANLRGYRISGRETRDVDLVGFDGRGQ